MATDLTAITDTINKSGSQGPRQFQGLFDVIPFKVTILDASLAAQVGGQCDVTVTGAALGDFAFIAPLVDNNAQLIQAYVTAADTVTISTFNMEGTDADTSFATASRWKGFILKPKANVWSGISDTA